MKVNNLGRNLRSYLDLLENHDLVYRVERDVDPKFGLSAVVKQSKKR